MRPGKAWFPTTALCALLLQACAVEVYDPATETTHLWGFGHLSVSKRTAADGTTAVVTGVESYGLTFARRPDETLLNLGARHSVRTDIHDEDAELVLDWDGVDLHTLRARGRWLADSPAPSAPKPAQETRSP